MSELSPPLSETEVRNEISSLTASERTKLIKIARSYGRISLEEPDELVHEAICRILDGTRKWPRDLEKLRFLAGVIKSIAGDRKRALACTRFRGHRVRCFDGVPSLDVLEFEVTRSPAF